MRFRWLILVVALGSLVYTLPTHAISNTDYLAIRGKTRLLTLDATPLSQQILGRGGQVIEIEGVVNGTFAGSDTSGFLLRLDKSQTLIFSAAKEDPDVAPGHTIRVLARVPMEGTVLEVVSVTEPGPNMPQLEIAQVEPEYDVPDIASPDYKTSDYTRGMQIYQPAGSRTPETYTGGSLVKQDWVVQRYAEHIKRANRNISTELATKIAFNILEKSEKYNIDPRLTVAVIAQESRFNPNAVSRAGAQGLGQLMPGTAASLGVGKPFDVEQNIEGCVCYLSTQINNFGRLSLALAAYNAGPGNVRRYGGIPPFRETQNYVRVIWKRYCELAGLDPKSGDVVASR
ncbi:MAG: lytic transglycosylase domain-containing protein [Armatimonadota bacterium]